MNTEIKLELSYEQVLSLVRQLPNREKIKLSKELEKEVIESKLFKLLDSFYTDELDMDTITEEVEAVRQANYERQTN